MYKIINKEINKEKYDEYTYIYKIIRTYVKYNSPLFVEDFNNGWPVENTYKIKISFNMIIKIIEVLNFLNFRNESNFSRDNEPMCALPAKSYAFYKKQKTVNNQYIYVFCLENDSECLGIFYTLYK